MTTGTEEFPSRVRERKKFSVFSETASSIIVTLKHCLWVEESEVKSKRGGLFVLVISR